MVTTRKQQHWSPGLAGVEERLDAWLEWLGERSREVMIGFVALVVLGGIVTLFVEGAASRRMEDFAKLAEIERALYTRLANAGVGGGELSPAGQEAATRAREEALGEVEALLAAGPAQAPAGLAVLRAAGLEVELGRLEAADARLAALVSQRDGTVRGAALRMRGFVLEELGRAEEGAELYMQAGATAAYRGRAEAYLSAGEVFERVGKPQRAMDAFSAAVAVGPDLADSPRLAERIADLARQVSEAAPAS